MKTEIVIVNSQPIFELSITKDGDLKIADLNYPKSLYIYEDEIEQFHAALNRLLVPKSSNPPVDEL